ncbi:MAG: Peptidase M23 [Candidatus Wolfebacteria bacterium GW2011_GWC1_43_10]|uniref:Peptidase M23 n=2 Tax=Candidatus Wolfeibacteriota TaxID=1752735 RepID=A0A0G1F5V0_9BACT|nr:MAG: Peptidase M23 [Candidatus Wolfebacteria bacterium GW2011_GWC1_43_10]OGM89862.1 MAG: hypothetical protein A2108_01005 [Candidatus Wolfebacteria bacterium GWA1_42_9]
MKKTAVIISIIGLVLVGSFGARLAFSQIYTAPTVQTYGATNIFNNAATFNGYVNSNGYQTTYYFEYGTNTSFGSTTSSQTTTSSTNVSYTVSGLSSNTTYYFRLVAYNSYGTVYGSTLNFNTSGSGGSTNTPSVQTTSATNVYQNSATLNGEINPNGYQTTYYFEYGTGSSLGMTTSYQTVDPYNYNRFASYQLSNLSQYTTYYFRLVAYNSYGTVYGSILNFNTGNYYYSGGSVTVSTDQAKNVTASSAVLWGLASTNQNTGTAWFEYGSSATSLTSRSSSITIFTSSYYSSVNLTPTFWATVSGLSNNTTYYYRAALQNGGNTVYGQIVSFTTSGSYTTPYTYYDPNYYTIPKYVYSDTYTLPTGGQASPYTNYYDYYGSPYNYSVSYVPYNQYVYSGAPSPALTYYDTNSNPSLQASVLGVTGNKSLTILGVVLLGMIVLLVGVIAFKRT